MAETISNITSSNPYIVLGIEIKAAYGTRTLANIQTKPMQRLYQHSVNYQLEVSAIIVHHQVYQI